jgi:hypothetical protein
LGEVVLGNRVAVEFGFEDGLDFGQAVEPFDQRLGLLAIEDALVKFGADIGGQPRYFSVSRHGFPLLGLLYWMVLFPPGH